MPLVIGVLLMLLLPASTTATVAGCRDETPCAVPLGSYHVALPAGPADGPVPAVVFFHGYGGSGLGAIRNRGMVGRFTDRGYAVIAPNGLSPSGGTGAGSKANWTVPGGRDTGRDDIAFTATVVADAVDRFGLDPDRLLATGFSKGGSFVWQLACAGSVPFRAYAPIAGAFWEPLPASCPGGPVDMMHIHGFADRTVPIEGRPVGDGAYVQGDTFAALDLLRRVNRCPDDRPRAFSRSPGLACRIWDACAPDREIRFCLHPGAHGLPKGWVTAVLDWFEARPGLPGPVRRAAPGCRESTTRSFGTPPAC